jgi:membrane fusion protein, multidrug efflux system
VLSAPSILFAALAASCSQPSADATSARPAVAPIEVATAVASTEQVPRLLRLTGTLRANAESAVAANASGQVVDVFVERGSSVVEGTPLIQINKRMASLSATEARANVEGIRRQKELADNEYARSKRLFERQLISAQDLEKAESNTKVLAQSLASAEARQRQSAVALSDTTVRAPFSGVVSERSVEVGEYVTPGTKVADLVQSDPIRIVLTVGEGDAGAVRVGQPLRFEVKAIPGRAFDAEVRYVAPGLRQATRDLVFEAVAPNPDGGLRAGMFATASVQTGTEDLVVVPNSALHEGSDTVRVYVVKNRRLEERVVHVARDLGDRSAVTAGIAAGERVVTSARERLRDGLAVAE